MAPIIQTVVFGSCLSRFIALDLSRRYSATILNNIYHISSEQFVKYYIQQKIPQIPREYLESFLVPSSEPQKALYAEGMIDNQYPETMGLWEFEPSEKPFKKPFLVNLEGGEIDLFLLDNFADLSGRPQYIVDDPRYLESPIQIVSHFYQNIGEISGNMRMGEYISPEDSAEYWSTIITFLSEKVPYSTIVFNCFFSSTSIENEARKIRANEFFNRISLRTFSRNVHIVPPVSVPKYLMNLNDWTHVDVGIYAALAGEAYLKYISDRARLEMVVD